jgi:hypothetical protein
MQGDNGMMTIPLGTLAAVRDGTVDPSQHLDEVFDLYSIPAFDAQTPEILAGRRIGSTKQMFCSRKLSRTFDEHGLSDQSVAIGRLHPVNGLCFEAMYSSQNIFDLSWLTTLSMSGLCELYPASVVRCGEPFLKM